MSILEDLSTLYREVDYLSERLNVLFEQLNPVVTPHPEEKPSQVKYGSDTPKSPVSSSLTEIIGQLNVISQRVNIVIDDLDITGNSPESSKPSAQTVNR